MFKLDASIGARCAAALLLALAAGTAAAQDAGDPVRGKLAYYVYGCYQCHGYNGQTGQRDLVATNSPLIADLATFRMFLRLRGDQAPLLPLARMPNYAANTLSDAAVADIYAYIRTFKLDAPAVASVQTLQKILDSAGARAGRAAKADR